MEAERIHEEHDGDDGETSHLRQMSNSWQGKKDTNDASLFISLHTHILWKVWALMTLEAHQHQVNDRQKEGIGRTTGSE